MAKKLSEGVASERVKPKRIAKPAVGKAKPAAAKTSNAPAKKKPAEKYDLDAIAASTNVIIEKRARKKPRAKEDEKENVIKLARQAAQFALEKKADNVKLLNLTGITSMTDCFVIASADSDRQVKAIAEHVITEMRDTVGYAPWRSEGWDTLRWVIIDFVDFVVHIFQSEARQFYNLERLWADAPSEDIKDAVTKPKRTRKTSDSPMDGEPKKSRTAKIRIVENE